MGGENIYIPDSVILDADRRVQKIHDHKHLGGKDYYYTKQLKAKYKLLEENQTDSPENFIITMTSNSPLVEGENSEKFPKPSKILSEKVTIYYAEEVVKLDKNGKEQKDKQGNVK